MKITLIYIKDRSRQLEQEFKADGQVEAMAMAFEFIKQNLPIKVVEIWEADL